MMDDTRDVGLHNNRDTPCQSPSLNQSAPRATRMSAHSGLVDDWGTRVKEFRRFQNEFSIDSFFTRFLISPDFSFRPNTVRNLQPY